MRVEKTICDRRSCKTGKEARHFLIFKDRKADGAGGRENIYYAFDLCPKCQGDILKWLFEHNSGSLMGENMLNSFQIEYRVE